MQKVTKKDFIENITKYNLFFHGSHMDQSLDKLKNLVDNYSKNTPFNRIAKDSNNSEINFYCSDENKISISSLALFGEIFFYKNFYIIIQDVYFIIYEIDTISKKMNFDNILSIKININKKLKNLKDNIKKFHALKKKIKLKKFLDFKGINKHNIKKMTLLQKSLLKKELNKKTLHNGKIYTIKELILNHDITLQIFKNDFNRRYYNSLDHVAQIKYEKRLKESKNYYLIFSDRNIKINKRLFDNITPTAPIPGAVDSTPIPGAVDST